jgi:hypothetical protein
VFAGIFFIVWFGAGVVTVNSKLLGGKLSIFQSVCVLGYCLFPLDLAAVICLFIPWMLARTIIVVCAFAWSFLASVGFVSEVGLANRKLLAVYPVFLFYFAVGWMIIITKSAV